MLRSYSNLNKGTGSVEVDLSPPPGYKWLVNHIAISSNSTTNSSCSIFVDDRFFCGSNIGNGDSADGTPLVVNEGNTLRAVWNGVTNATCKLSIIVEQVGVGT